MSFYVTALDKDKEISWLCGWQWFDLGRALGTLGVSNDKDNEVYILDVDKLADIFEYVDNICKDFLYIDLEQLYSLDNGVNYEDYFYEVIIGYDRSLQDNMDYNTIKEPEVAKAVRRAYYDYVKSYKEEQRVRHFEYLKWITKMTENIQDEYLQRQIQEKMKDEEFIHMVQFMREVRDYVRENDCKVITLVLG